MKKRKNRAKKNKKPQQKTTFTTPSRGHWKNRTKSRGSLSI